MTSELEHVPSSADTAEPVPTTYSRRMISGGWSTLSDGSQAHFVYSRAATPEQENWCQINDPMRGLHTEADRAAYRQSKRGPVMRFLAGLKFGHKKEDDTFVVPEFLRHQSD